MNHFLCCNSIAASFRVGLMWTPENRPRYNRDKLRYPSDLTDEEWGHVDIKSREPSAGAADARSMFVRSSMAFCMC